MKRIKPDRYMAACKVYNALLNRHVTPPAGESLSPCFREFMEAPVGIMDSTKHNYVRVSEKAAPRIDWLLGPHAETLFRAWLHNREAA